MIDMDKINKELEKKEIKICKDCRYYSSNYIYFHHCNHPTNLRINIVNGLFEPKNTAFGMRNDENLCSLKAKFFKPIKVKKVIRNKSWWEKFKSKLWWDLK
jgi:hypothetical protein